MKKIWLMYLACFVLIFTLPICIVQIGKIGVYDNLDSNYPIAKLKSTGKITTYIKAEDKVEEVELEDYLRGVLAAEMPVTFPLEALKAQAVAARTYIINKIVNVKGEIPEHHGAQVCTDSAHCKAWMSKEERLEKWPEAERDNYWNKITAAVQDTAGEIMTYDGKPVTAVFYAISSGKTERAADVWGSDVPYLQSVDSPVDKNAPGFESTVSMSVQEFKNKMSAARPEAAFSANPQEWYQNEVRSEGGGVTHAVIGGVEVKGGDIRTIFGLRSTNFTLQLSQDQAVFQVKGYGHGVGMSQWGAKFYAEEGKNYKDILKLYYQGVSIEKLNP